MAGLDHCLEVQFTVKLGVGWENGGQEPKTSLLHHPPPSGLGGLGFIPNSRGGPCLVYFN